jgi:DNA-binding IclR family transcriptional regulator
MNARHRSILNFIETHPSYNATEIANYLDLPAASVRRAVASLRKQGFDISFSSSSYSGSGYRFLSAAQQPAIATESGF